MLVLLQELRFDVDLVHATLTRSCRDKSRDLLVAQPRR